MQVICIEEPAYYVLLEKSLAFLKEHIAGGYQERWIDDKEAMKLLNIKAKSTLQQLRDEGKIRFSQPQKRVILYDRQSIYTYLDKHAKNTF